MVEKASIVCSIRVAFHDISQYLNVFGYSFYIQCDFALILYVRIPQMLVCGSVEPSKDNDPT